MFGDNNEKKHERTKSARISAETMHFAVKLVPAIVCDDAASFFLSPSPFLLLRG